MTPEMKNELRELLLRLVPADGSNIGNTTLMRQFSVDARQIMSEVGERDFWEVRNDLLEQGVLGKGRGRGGSVFRIPSPIPAETVTEEVLDVEPVKSVEVLRETDLYEPFYQTVDSYWVRENNLKYYIVENTALQGRKKTGGRWTRPDITLISVGNYPYIPGKVLEVTTFEIKPCNSFDVTGVFEAAAHSVFAHRSYLALHCSDSSSDDPDLDRIKAECRRLDVGLLLFEDAASGDTWIVDYESPRREPDPRDINDFISKQISEARRTVLLEMLK